MKFAAHATTRAVIAAFCVLASFGTNAQVMRDAPAVTTSMKGVSDVTLSGSVMADGVPPAPVQRAIVIATRPGAQSGIAALTDENGRFSISGLAPGRFKVTAIKPGYLSATLGTTRPGADGLELVTLPGQRVTELSLILRRGAAIQGALRDAGGLAVQQARVSAFVCRGARVAATPVAVTTSDDVGAYRLAGLADGDYLLVATTTRDVQSGATLEVPSRAANDAALAALERKSNPLVMPTGLRPNGAEVTAAPVFFPGTVDSGRATLVTIEAGRDVAADITWVETRAASVEGLVGSLPPDAQLSISMEPVSDLVLPPLVSSRPFLAVRPGKDGRFRFTGALPGRYILRVTATARPGNVVGSNSQGLSWALQELEIGGTDVSGVQLNLQPAVRVRGTIAVDLTKPMATKERLVKISLKEMSALSGSASGGMSTPIVRTVVAKAPSSFEFPDVVPGRHVLEVQSDDLSLLAVEIGGMDITGQALDVVAGENRPVLIALSDRLPTLSGKVVAVGHVSLTSYSIVAVDADHPPGLLPRARAVRVDSSGAYNLKSQRPGRYLIALVTDFAEADLLDLRFLASLAPASVSVTLALGERRILDFTQAVR